MNGEVIIMRNVFVYIWRVLRYWKPARTFWLTLSGLLPIMATGIDSGNVGLHEIDWFVALSASFASSIFTFVVLMAGNDSMWSEPAENSNVVNLKPRKLEIDLDRDISEEF